MRYGVLLCAVLIAGCSHVEEVTVVMIQDTPNCTGGKATVFDSETRGRFMRCGVWGRPGETFQFNILS